MVSSQTKLTVGSLAVLAVIIGAARFGMREPTPPSPESIVSDHPVEIKVGPWYRWQVTELVMDERGRHYPQPDPTHVDFLDSQRKGFRRKFGSAAKLGFHEGQVPPSDEFCGAPYPVAKILSAPPRSNLDFTLMIHDVAITATIDEVIPGFWGGPIALVSLDRVEQLHIHSRVPRYALVPLGRMVARDAVYCAQVIGKRGFNGRRGQRIVLIGRYDEEGVVLLGWYQDPALLVFGEGLENWFGGVPPGATIERIEEAARKVVSTGLYDYAAELRHADPDTDHGFNLRRDLGAEVVAATENGCELSGAVQTPDGWTLTTACEPNQRLRVREPGKSLRSFRRARRRR